MNKESVKYMIVLAFQKERQCLLLMLMVLEMLKNKSAFEHYMKEYMFANMAFNY